MVRSLLKCFNLLETFFLSLNLIYALGWVNRLHNVSWWYLCVLCCVCRLQFFQWFVQSNNLVAKLLYHLLLSNKTQLPVYVGFLIKCTEVSILLQRLGNQGFKHDKFMYVQHNTPNYVGNKVNLTTE